MDTKTVVFEVKGKDVKKTKNPMPSRKDKDERKHKKRVAAEKWTFAQEDYAPEAQMTTIQSLLDHDGLSSDSTTKIALQQIHQKLYGYKQQDIYKRLYDGDKFLTLKSVLTQMISCALKCYYCDCDMLVLYDIAREAKQWTVDRIDNSLGHNVDNFYLACLDCNLKRRCRNDDKFLFTKQLTLVKLDATNSENSSN